MIKTHPEDMELAFKLLKNSLFRRADELSTTARGFYNWLQKYLTEAKTKQFTALDIRKTKRLHPRTLNRYLQELCLFHYIQVTGGNKYREGYRYKITNMDETDGLNGSIEKALQATLKNVWNAYGNTKPDAKTEQEQKSQNTNKTAEAKHETKPAFFERHYKRLRINAKEEHTLKILLELEAKERGRQYQTSDITAITKRSQCIEAKYLKTLWEQGKLERQWKNRQYIYTLVTTDSGTVSQTPLTNTENQQQ
jgi:hypothetical protein